MSGFPQFLEDLLRARQGEAFQSLVCKISTFDKSKLRADVIPVLKTIDKNEKEIEYGVLGDIPVNMINGGGGYFIRPDYKKDDLVWVNFSTYDISEALENNAVLESKENINNMLFCAVVSGVIKNDETLPSEFSEDGILIGKHTNGTINSMIQIKDDTILAKNASGQYELKANGQVAINNTALTVDA